MIVGTHLGTWVSAQTAHCRRWRTNTIDAASRVGEALFTWWALAAISRRTRLFTPINNILKIRSAE